jgi:glycosyltransferase involved in cell wall biosynthesis
LTRQKNFQFLIKAYAHVKQEVTNLPKLLIIGEGEEKKYLTEKIKEHKVEKDVLLLGYRNNVFPYLNKSLFFLLSSDWEDPGFVLVEAAASNKLILSSDVLSGPKEFLYNKNSGFLYEKDDFTDFKNKIKYILNNINSKEIYLKKVNAKKNSKKYTIFHHYKELSKLL